MVEYFEDELVCWLDDFLLYHPRVSDSAKNDRSGREGVIWMAGIFSNFKYWVYI